MQILISPKTKSTGGKITDRIKTFEDACEVLGLDGAILTGQLNDSLDDIAPGVIAFTKLAIIVKALNEGWKPDWKNSREEKWYQWFDLSKGFEFVNVVSYYQHSNVSSRLCFVSEDVARYAATQFADLYKDFFTI